MLVAVQWKKQESSEVYINTPNLHLMVVIVITMLVPISVHFGHQHPSSTGVDGMHVHCVAQATRNLGFAEKLLARGTVETRH